MSSKEDKNAIISFYMNMEEWFLDLDENGKRLFYVWIDTGDAAPLAPYLPRPVRDQIIDRIPVATVERREERRSVGRQWMGIVDFAQ